MKTLKTTMFVTACMAMMCACTDQSTLDENQGSNESNELVELKINPSIALTRAAVTGTEGSALENIAVYSSGTENNYAIYEYSSSPGGWGAKSGAGNIYLSKDPVTIFAYYPAYQANGSTALEINVTDPIAAPGTSSTINVSLNEDAIREYTNQLGDKYDNIGETRTVTRWSGEQIKISTTPGIYYVDRNTTISEIEDAIKSGKSVTKDLTFKTPTATDEYVLNTFVEVDLTNQTVIYYKNGEVITQGNVVTGNVSQGHATPAGVYKLDWKAKDYVLRGQGYASPVNFWMPFNGGIGLHDASWRSQFGGSIYKTNGSHGCVNMTYSVAKAIYDNIEEHTTIICKY